jgi:glycosyltransferase involved in cell wall biosynthesis
MRVALLASSAAAGDALGHQVAAQARCLADRGWEVRLYLGTAAGLRADLAPFLAAEPTRPWRAATERAYLLQADLVLAVYSDYFPLLDLLPALAEGRPRVVLSYHGVTPSTLWDAADRHRREEDERQRAVVWCADAALAHSRFTTAELHRATGFPLDRIHTLGCAVEEVPAAAPACDVRARFGLANQRVLLFVGRLAANKRAPLLVEALAHLDATVHAVLVGDTGDVYAAQAEACRELAARRGVAGRLHLTGKVGPDELEAWYRTADVLALPSVHEGFGMPAVEAMARGLPVVAARAAALPETLGPAGLTFTPDDARDLARQVGRVLSPVGGAGASGKAVAVVAPRFGTDFVGGAETSLRTIATALRADGYRVEVFTTCNRHDCAWANHLPAGTTTIDGLTVHRFPIDPHDRSAHLAALEPLRRGEPLTDAEEAAYLAHSLHASALVAELERRRGEFAAVVAGPYLFGLTREVARRLGSQVLLLPCFHDEPPARLRAFRETYAAVGGLLYHTPEEQQLAEAVLGINHPYATVLGTCLDLTPGDGDRGRARCGPNYLVYCGRYSPEKGVDRLLDFVGRYAAEHPERFRLVCLGQGGMRLPAARWLLDLGFVSEAAKRDVIAGARALVQLSPNESLSLAALEAWAAGVPVIAGKASAVLRGQLRRSGGGRAVGEYADFAAALDSLWKEPEAWRQAGAAGRAYVTDHYGSPAAFAARLRSALHGQRVPLPEQLCRQGRKRAAEVFGRAAWEERFTAILDEVLEQPRRTAERPPPLEVVPQVQRRTVACDSATVLVAVRVSNPGPLPAAARGPARVEVAAVIGADDGRGWRAGPLRARLPGLLPAGQGQVVVVPVAVPRQPGTYRVGFVADRPNRLAAAVLPAGPVLTLEVQAGEPAPAPAGPAAPFVTAASGALAEAYSLQTLPTAYRDVTQGVFAGWKRWLKQKLLHNFRRAFVEVLARQQSRFNGQVLTALCHLADAQEAQAQAAAGGGGEAARLAARLRGARRELRRLRRRVAELEKRIAERPPSARR